MKNIAVALCLTLFLAACSSGTSVSDIPPTITGFYSGPYVSSDGQIIGTFVLNLAEGDDGDVEGTIQASYQGEAETICEAINATIAGSVNGFNVRLETAEITIEIITTDLEGELEEEDLTGTFVFQLTADGNALFGTYTNAGDALCPIFSGTGNVALTR